MRSLFVVLSDELPKDSPEVPFAEDKDVVQTLLAHGPHETLGEGVCLGRAYGGADNAQALRAKHLIERPWILGVAVTDQEPGPRQSILGGPAE